MEHFYVIDRELVGFYYVPYAGSAPIHGTLECSEDDLPRNVKFFANQKECYVAVHIDHFGSPPQFADE
jgi:hypothetical protein